ANQAIIDAEPALRERQRQKYADLAGRLGEALRDRGVGDLAAMLAAESAAIVFTLAFAQWLADGESRSLSLIIAETLAELRSLYVPR
ncbi:TetR family transcriptional regulator, partial [Micromonospora azadirachtae]